MEISLYFIWAVIGIVAIVVELNTSAQIGWGAAIGSSGAIITHAITKGDPVWVEFAVFALLWVLSWSILFIFIKQIRHKIHDKEDGYLKYIGDNYKVVKGNSDEFGEIKINGKIFRFKSSESIRKGETVKVIEIKGVTFKVGKIK